MNHCQLIGRAGGDSEFKKTSYGTSLLTFNLATSEKIGEEWKTFWHKIVLLGRIADSMKDRILKGNKVFVAGKIQPKDYVDKEGNKRTSVAIIAFAVEVIVTPPKHDESVSPKDGDNFNEQDIPF